MADAVLTPSGGLMPSGTSASVFYPWQKHLGGSPAGTALTTATVADNGTLTFTGLLSGTLYTAYAVVDGSHRYIDFETERPEESTAEVDLSQVNADITALATRVNYLETTGTAYPDASTTVKGSVKLSGAPADAANPIAVGDNDSRILQVADHETRLDAAEVEIAELGGQVGAQEVGVTTLPTSATFPVSGNHSTVVLVSPPSDGSWEVTTLRVWIAAGPGGVGSTNLRPVVYQDVGGSVITGELLATGTPRLVATPGAPSREEFTFSSPPIIDGDFWIGLHADLGPGANQSLGYPYTDLTGRYVQNTDTYSDGSVSPFGSVTFDATRTLGISVVLSPSDPDFEGMIDAVASDLTDTVAVQAVTDAAQDTRLTALEAGAGGGVTTAVDYSGELDTDDVYIGSPQVNSGAALVVAAAEAEQTGTLAIETLVSGTFLERKSAATTTEDAGEVADLSVITGAPEVRRTYTQGATGGLVTITGTVS